MAGTDLALLLRMNAQMSPIMEDTLDTTTSAPRVLDREPVVVADKSRVLYELARRVAITDCTVMIAGESGTGKEVLARYIHARSPRAARAFVAVNCAAIPENMLEALLFGYERGSFTGAATAHAGKFEQAQGGTLLLDEITEMPLSLQAKLLRVLQEREVERIGGRGPIPLDVRVIATTNRNLRAEVAAGRFREDLFYRLCVFPLGIAALRDRRDDVLPLAMQLLAARCRPGGAIPALSADAAHLLLTYPWPGNVRELDNLLQRALILASGPVIDAEHIRFESITEGGVAHAVRAPTAAPSAAVDGEAQAALRGSLRDTERDLILDVLGKGASRREAADRLGISPRTLRYKLARLRAEGADVPAA
jgi:two-component system, response regulator FlrC